MPTRLLAALSLAMLALTVPASAADDYKLGPDSFYKDGVPKGETTRFSFTSTKIFPGCRYDYWVYVPKQYDATRPASVMLFMDGGGFADVNGGLRAPVVLDNLIHKKEMPITIAIMVNPGVLPSANPNALPRFNRSLEYDGMGDRNARFLSEELLPEVAKKWNLTTDPSQRGICGNSSGGIAAFTAAWERPDLFRRVVSFIGSFTNLRGGHHYPTMIRKFEPRSFRVFMQDGSNDQDIYSGSWFIGNNDVYAALKYANQDVNYVVGDGGHNGKHAGSLLPDALRWVWRESTTPITKPASSRQTINQIVAFDEAWQKIEWRHGEIKGMATDSQGALYATNERGAIYKLDSSGLVGPYRPNGAGKGIAFGPDGNLYIAQANRIVSISPTGKETVVANRINADRIVVNRAGEMLFSDAVDGVLGKIVNGKVTRQKGRSLPVGVDICLTPDQTLALRSNGHQVSSFQVVGGAAPEVVQHELPYVDLFTPHGGDRSGAAGLAVDAKGWLYVATLAGVQVVDQAGRVNGIIETPLGVIPVRIAFGGPDKNTIYLATQNGELYKRKTKATGAFPFLDPIKPPSPRL